MKIIIKLPFFLSIFWASLLMGQERWSLERCIDYAHQHNLQIKQQELAIERGENVLQQAKLNYLPSVSASVNHSMNWGRSVNVQDLEIIENKLSQSTSANARASINLFEGLTKGNDIQSKKILLEISKSEVEKLRNEISIEIARSYLQILLSYEILESSLQNLETTKKQAIRTQKMVDAGTLPFSSQLEIEAQIAQENVQVVNAQNQLRNSLLNLAQLLDLPSNENFDIEKIESIDTLQEHITIPVERLFALSQSLPQIRISQLNLENSKLQLSIAKGRLYPSLSFSAGYGSYYSDSREQPFFDQFNENRNPSIGFGINFPIFNNLATRTNLKNAHIGVRSAEIEQRQRGQALYKEIQQADNEALALYQRYIASKQNVRAMEESFRYVQQKFDVGILNATDFSVSKNNLFKARSEYSQVKFQYLFQMKILDFYKGLPIKL